MTNEPAAMPVRYLLSVSGEAPGMLHLPNENGDWFACDTEVSNLMHVPYSPDLDRALICQVCTRIALESWLYQVLG